MFLLFLCLGTASVKAQVRIGGNTAPNSAAVLDLNATDTSIGTKGLVFPRVTLTSNTMQITTGVANLNGMLVYNTTATLGAGIYSWVGGIWKRIDAVPIAVTTDSGRFLMSTGSGGVAWSAIVRSGVASTGDSIKVLSVKPVTSWNKLIDTTILVQWYGPSPSDIQVIGLTNGDLCYPTNSGNYTVLWVAGNNWLRAYSMNQVPNRSNLSFRCYRSL